MELFVSIGARLRAERERLGKSQSELVDVAASVGVRGTTRQSQSLYEKGERAPDAGYLAAVAGIGVDVRYVITGARDYEPPPPLKAEEQLLLDRYREASAAVKNAALGALLGARASAGGEISQVVHSGGSIKHNSVSVTSGDNRGATIHHGAAPKKPRGAG